MSSMMGMGRALIRPGVRVVVLEVQVEEGFLHICCETVYSYDYYGFMTDNSEGVYGFCGWLCFYIYFSDNL